MSEEADLGRVQSEVSAAHVRLDAYGREIGDIKTTMRGMDTKLGALLAREPSRMPFWALGGVLAVLLTILSLVTAPLAARVWATSEKLEEHTDGHPQWVTKLFAKEIGAMTQHILRVDKQHAEEHLEQEEDIRDLRLADAKTEDRNDKQDAALARLEVVAHERTERFKRIVETLEAAINVRSGDRWTASEEQVYQHQHEREHDLERQTWNSRLNTIYNEQEQFENLQHRLRGPGRGLGVELKESLR